MKKSILSVVILIFLITGLKAQTEITLPTLTEKIVFMGVSTYANNASFVIDDGVNPAMQVDFNFAKGETKGLYSHVLTNAVNQFYKQSYRLISTVGYANSSSGNTNGYYTNYLFQKD